MGRSPDEYRMTFAEHLEELRGRIIFSLVAFAIAFGVAFGFQETLLRFFTRPYRLAVGSINESLRKEWSGRTVDASHTLTSRLIEMLSHEPKLSEQTSKALGELQKEAHQQEAPQLPMDLQAVALGESFGAYMRVVMLAAALAAAPVLLVQIWKFIAAGLYDHEKRMVARVLPWSLVLFFAGLAFGFFVLAEISVHFLVSYGDIEIVRPQVAVGPYLGLLFLVLLVMGLVFQIPLVMTVLASVGLVQPEWFRSKRRHCILAIFVLAAIITPPDFVSQLIVAGPMLFLFEMGIYFAKGAKRRREARLAAQDSGKTSQDPKS